MNEVVRPRDLEGQAASTGNRRKRNCGLRNEGWVGPLRQPRAPTQDELALPQRPVPGHRWEGWRRLTGDEAYFAACSCGWRSAETDNVSAMLRPVKSHLDAVRLSRASRPSAQPLTWEQCERDASRGDMQPDECSRELYASVEGQQKRLSQSLKDSTELLCASADQADSLVVALERREWDRTRAVARSPESVQHKVCRAKELRHAIVSAAAALTAIAEEIALIHQDRESYHPRDSADCQCLVGEASETAGTARKAGRTSSG